MSEGWMRFCALMLVLALRAAAQTDSAGCAPTPLTPGDRAAGWKLLSGSDAASQWIEGIGRPFPAKAWAVQGSCLHLKNPRDGGSLFSSAQFDNFELAFEWRIAPAGNSGVKYMAVDGRRHPDVQRLFVKPRLTRLASYALPIVIVLLLAWKKKWLFREHLGRWIGFGVCALLATLMLMVGIELFMGLRQSLIFPPGLEYQVIDDEGNADAKSGGPTHRSGALYDVLPPTGVELRRDTFNEARILVIGNHAEHWLNGRKVLEYEFGSAALKDAIARSKFAGLPEMAEKSPGRLELQNHGDPVWFRNMRIRELR